MDKITLKVTYDEATHTAGIAFSNKEFKSWDLVVAALKVAIAEGDDEPFLMEGMEIVIDTGDAQPTRMLLELALMTAEDQRRFTIAQNIHRQQQAIAESVALQAKLQGNGRILHGN